MKKILIKIGIQETLEIRGTMRIFTCLAVLITAFFTVIGCTSCKKVPENQIFEKEMFAMDTTMQLKAYGPNASKGLAACEKEINSLQAQLDVTQEDSDLSGINQTGKGTVSEEVGDMIFQAITYYRGTEGMFDPTVYSLNKLWGFYDESYQVPTSQEIREALKTVNGDHLLYDAKTDSVVCEKNVKIDLGGIAKGFTSETCIKKLKEEGVTSAILNLGGNVQVLGKKPDGSLWNVGIANPDQPEETIAEVQVKDACVITSGSYQRFFEKNGKKYHHIMDPKTGKPAESGLKSVTVITGNGTMGDALATAYFVMGKDKALEAWKEREGVVDIVFVEEDGTMTITPGLEKNFKSDHKYKVAKGGGS